MADSYEDLVAEAKAKTEQTDVDTVHEALIYGEDLTIVDVREIHEYEEAHLPGAKHTPRGMLESRAAEELPDRKARIVTSCAAGGVAHSPPRASRSWVTQTWPTWKAA
jgi:rhodanese-related sulfurtransferase